MDDAHLLLVAVGQIVDLLPQVQVEDLREFMDACLRGLGVPGIEGNGVPEQVDGPHVVVVEDFGRQIPHLPPNLRAKPSDVLAEDCGRPACGVDEPEEGPDRGGLPCAVRADEAVDLAVEH